MRPKPLYLKPYAINANYIGANSQTQKPVYPKTLYPKPCLVNTKSPNPHTLTPLYPKTLYPKNLNPISPIPETPIR